MTTAEIKCVEILSIDIIIMKNYVIIVCCLVSTLSQMFLLISEKDTKEAVVDM